MSGTSIKRRTLINHASAYATILASFGLSSAKAQPDRPGGLAQPGLPRVPVRPGVPRTTTAPMVPFKVSPNGEQVSTPYGTMRLLRSGDELFPATVSAAGRLATIDFTGRSALTRFGTGNSAIVMSASGVKFGAEKERAWNKDTYRRLIDGLVRDRTKARGAMLLRSILLSGYPIALHAMQSVNQAPIPPVPTAAPTSGPLAPIAQLPSRSRIATTIAKRSASMGGKKTNCSTTTVVDTVYTELTEYRDKILTAAQQFQKCFDEAVKDNVCGLLTVGCAVAFCTAAGFIDIVVGTIEVVSIIAEEVERLVVTCAKEAIGEWRNPWTYSERVGASAAVVGQPKKDFDQKTIDDALALLKNITGFLGPFGTCFLEGEWSLAQLDTKLTLAGNKIVIPYGLKVCLTSNCGRQLSIENVWAPTLAAWSSALSVLAALSAEFAAIAAPMSIVASAPVVALVAATGPEVAAAAAIILAFLLLALIYMTAISAQLWFQGKYTDNFSDNMVCIEHPSFAIAAVSVATGGSVPAVLIPPIVTG